MTSSLRSGPALNSSVRHTRRQFAERSQMSLRRTTRSMVTRRRSQQRNRRRRRCQLKLKNTALTGLTVATLAQEIHGTFHSNVLKIHALPLLMSRSTATRRNQRLTCHHLAASNGLTGATPATSTRSPMIGSVSWTSES